MSWYCNTCEKGLTTNANPTCETCAVVEKNLEKYLATIKGRQFVRRALVKVSLEVRSRGEREI